MTCYATLFLTGDRLCGYAYDVSPLVDLPPGYEDDRLPQEMGTEVLRPVIRDDRPRVAPGSRSLPRRSTGGDSERVEVKLCRTRVDVTP
jgi:hypothetical protein